MALNPTHDRTKRNVDYILLAEFDIDKGSTVKHQYPQPCGVAENVLADWMLPAGAHLRETDWTVFFLREEDFNTGETTEIKEVDKAPHQELTSRQIELRDEVLRFTVDAPCFQFDQRISDWSPFYESGSQTISFSLKEPALPDRPLQFYMNIVANEAAGSASGKTLAYIMVHPDIQFTLLQDRFCSLYPDDGEAIGILFPTSEDLTNLNDLLEKILAEEEEYEEGRWENTINAPQEIDEKEAVNSRPTESIEGKQFERIYCLNLVRTQHDSTVRRGAVCKSMAICTTHRWFMRFKPLLLLALDRYFLLQKEEVLAELYQAIDDMDLSQIPRLSELDKRVMRASQKLINTDPSFMDPEYHYQTFVLWRNAKIPVNVPLIMDEEEVAGVSVVELVKRFGPATPIVYDAILREKRIIFLGHNEPAGEVCNNVLSACMLLCPPLLGVLARAYPYANLTCLDFLQTPGYIAGVTNPIFEHRKEWWDVLCNISTGEIILNETYAKIVTEQDPENRCGALDAELMSEVDSGIALNYGEEWIRSRFRDYTERIIGMSYKEEPFTDAATREIHTKGLEHRLEAWKRTLSYKLYDKNRAVRISNSRFGDMFATIKNHIRSLQVLKVKEDQLIQVFDVFLSHLNTREELLEFLSYLRPSQGSLFPVAVCIFNGNGKVRDATTRLLRRIEELPEGGKLVHSLNFYVLLTYNRMKAPTVQTEQNSAAIDYHS